MKFIATPLLMVTQPNFFQELADNRWELINPNAQVLWLQLKVDDSLGLRRYIPAAGSLLSVVFQRADDFQMSTTPRTKLQVESRSITKTATTNMDDRSLWNISLTSQDVAGVLSGTVKFSLTEAGVVNTWVQNYFLKKNMTDPGF